MDLDKAVELWQENMERGHDWGKLAMERKPDTAQALHETAIYDSMNAFMRAWEYTGEPIWRQYAETAHDRIYGPYVRGKLLLKFEPGNIVRFRKFTDGCTRLGLLGDKEAKETALLVAQYAEDNRDASPPELPVHEGKSAGCRMLDWCNQFQLEGVKRKNIDAAMDGLLKRLEAWMRGEDWNLTMDLAGLQLEALVRYYRVIKDDQSIVEPMTDFANWLWATYWKADKHGWQYYARNPQRTTASVNLYLCPTYAWLFTQTGDEQQLQRALTLFIDGAEHGLHGYTPLGPAVTWSLQYRWVTDMFEWINPT